jgi:hypothetical protein
MRSKGGGVDAVAQSRGDRFNARTQCLDGADAESLDDEPAQPGVVRIVEKRQREIRAVGVG